MIYRRAIRPVLETYDHSGRLFRRTKAYRRQWSSYYGQKGGGFGWLSWQEDRVVGHDVPGLGFLYRVILRKGLAKTLFDGFVVSIEESQGDRDAIVVTALGWSSVFDDDTFNQVYSDARPGKWARSDQESGSFQPRKFEVNLSGQVWLEPRRGVDFAANEYTYARYTFPFGSQPKRIVFDYDLALPGSWPGRLEVRDDVGVLWSATATGTGSQDLKANSGAAYFEVRFYVTSAGENTAADNAVYGRLANAAVYDKDDETIGAELVMKDLVAYLAAHHGLSAETNGILPTGRALPDTVAFEDDWTPRQIMEWCAGFGGEDDALLAWGIELNDRHRAYLERQDLAAIKYVIRRRSGLTANVKGDFKESAQVTYGVYTDPDGAVQRTADVSDANAIAGLGGGYRRVAYRVEGSGIGEATALEVANMALGEGSSPKVTTSFSVSDKVYTATGRAVPVDEIQAGGIVLVDDFRAHEAVLSASDDYRTQWSSFQLVGVEIDEENGTARLIPAGDRRGFEQFLARLSEVQKKI